MDEDCNEFLAFGWNRWVSMPVIESAVLAEHPQRQTHESVHAKLTDKDSQSAADCT